jgi:DNA-directed RNA polymerase subunit RPC12/RpoP
MWKLKKCTRCGGNMFVDQDEYGWYGQCLQCGSRRDLENIIQAREKAGEGGLKQAEGSAQVR